MQGKVTSQADGSAISGASIQTNPVTSVVYSDQSGNFSINGIAQGDYIVTALKTDFQNHSTAPNIMMKDTSGNQIDLGKIKADNILILFYASWCPHCQVMIPKLAEYLKIHKRNNLKVLAISLDTDRNAWINFIRNNKLGWINISDLKGWSGKAASDYFIYATPIMFLLDRDKKIIGKPTTISELNKLF